MAYPVQSPLNHLSRKNKVIMQRQYREKEGECFNTLRDVIKEVSGDEIHTRQEILRKAIDLLLNISEIKKQERRVDVSPAPDGRPPFTDPDPPDMTGAQALLSYSAQPTQWSETLLASADSVPQSAYYIAQLHDQQYDFLSDMASTSVPANYQEYGEDLAAYYRP